MENERQELEPKIEDNQENKGEGVKEEKPELTLEQRKGILQRQLTKINKELGIEDESKEVKPAENKNNKDFDYAEKTFLKINNVEKEDYTFVKEVMDSTGKSLDDVLESKYFQAELKERKELRASREAMPETSKRSSGSAKDSVEYWISKGELPPADQAELRRKVVNEKIRQKDSGSKFTQTPIVS